MREFDMRCDAANLTKGEQWLSELTSENVPLKLGLSRSVAVPRILHPPSSHALVMECVPGENLGDAQLSDETSALIASDLILLHLHGLLRGPALHCDLHPGNIILHREHRGLILVDWNPVIQIPPESRGALHELMIQLHTTGGLCSMDEYSALGVRIKTGMHAPEKLLQMGKFFNLPCMVDGDFNLTECLQEFQKFQFPEWLLLLQKATMALSSTLVSLKVPSDFVRSRVDGLLRGPLSPSA